MSMIDYRMLEFVAKLQPCQCKLEQILWISLP